MTQQGTSVQAHPANPVDTSTAIAEPEEAQLDCDRPAHTPAARTDADLPKLGSVMIDVQGDTFDLHNIVTIYYTGYNDRYWRTGEHENKSRIVF
jgi:hypothetical protein